MYVYTILILQMTLNNEIVNFIISDKSLGMYELNKKLSLARQRGYIFNQKNKLTKKFIIFYQI